jgi:MerR family transcriptional regulator, copper efflux regulator
VTPKTLRYYERLGLLPRPARTESGYRDYGAEILDRLGFIRAAQASSLSLGEIRSVVALRDRGKAPCDRVRQLLQRRTAELDRRIEQLTRMRSELEGLTRRARRLSPSDCRPGGICHLITPSSAHRLPKAFRRRGGSPAG